MQITTTEAPRSKVVEYLLIDLDGTCYDIGNKYEDHVRNNLWKYMNVKFGIPIEKAEEVWRPLFRKYNQSLRGLRAGGFDIEAEEYWNCLRAGAEQFLFLNKEVQRLLQSLPQAEKWLFTNCSEKHANHALELLGLKDCFKGVIGADMMGDICKPEPAAFQIALKHIGADPAKTAMFEDSVKNLRTAKALGITTLLIAGPTALEERASTAAELQHCDGIVSTLSEAEVRRALPNLWTA